MPIHQYSSFFNEPEDVSAGLLYVFVVGAGFGAIEGDGETIANGVKSGDGTDGDAVFSSVVAQPQRDKTRISARIIEIDLVLLFIITLLLQFLIYYLCFFL